MSLKAVISTIISNTVVLAVLHNWHICIIIFLM